MTVCPPHRTVLGKSAFARLLGTTLFMMMLWASLCGIAQARTAKIELTMSGDEGMEADIRSLVEGIEKNQPLTGDGLSLLQGAQAALARVNAALRSRGFYDAEVNGTFDGRPIADAAALDAIEARPEADAISFSFNIKTGPRYRIGQLVIRPPGAMVSMPDIDRSKLELAPGDPADAGAIIGAQERLLSQLREHGYALAAIKDREVIVDHATREADVTFIVESGPTARMGPVRFSGTEKVDTVWLQRRVPFKEG